MLVPSLAAPRQKFPLDVLLLEKTEHQELRKRLLAIGDAVTDALRELEERAREATA